MEDRQARERACLTTGNPTTAILLTLATKVLSGRRSVTRSKNSATSGQRSQAATRPSAIGMRRGATGCSTARAARNHPTGGLQSYDGDHHVSAPWRAGLLLARRSAAACAA